MFRWLLRSVIVAMLVGVACLCPGNALAQKGSQNVAGLLKKGLNFFEDQRYEESTQTLSAALLRPDITKSERLQVFKLLAFNYILLDKRDEADGAVRGLLVTDESFQLPATESPRFRDFFAESKTRWVAEGRPGQKASGGDDAGTVRSAVKIRHSSPAQVKKGSTLALTGEIDDAEGQVAQVRLYFRQGSSEKFTATKVKYAMRKFSVDVPSSAVRPPLVEYYLEALDERGIPVGTRGDVESPLRVAVPETGSVLTSPWLWVPVGVAVVAAVVIPVVILSTQTSTTDVNVTVTE
ncbi:MAG: hypothetical protein FJ096_00055 [Deltaproteobacteria bacterium]|nr:hypothetical protein [Deltaproteobacteria bacterium]